MLHDIDHILISRGAISDRVRELGEAITKDLGPKGEEREIVVVAVMTGSIIFVADLMRCLPMKVRIQITTASSYIGKSIQSMGNPEIGVLPDVTDKHVLLVDDILDSGKTLTRIRGELEQLKPNSIHSCVLLRKKLPSAMKVPCEYVGFDIEDEFVVGYGMDYRNYFRNANGIFKVAP